MTNLELIKIIETQDYWDSEEFKELLKRANIDPTLPPYVIDGEAVISPENIYAEAKTKLAL